MNRRGISPFNKITFPDPVVRAMSWVRTVPELRSRPYLVAAMADNEKLRRIVMAEVEKIVPLAEKLYGWTMAEFVVQLVYESGKARLIEAESMMTENVARAELQGFYRNVWRNVMRDLSNGDKYTHRGPHDVDRVSWDRVALHGEGGEGG